MSAACFEAVGVLSAITGTLVAELPAAGQLEEIGRWPITIALVALSGFSVWMAFRTAERQADALKELASELKQRPCIRKPEND